MSSVYSDPIASQKKRGHTLVYIFVKPGVTGSPRFRLMIMAYNLIKCTLALLCSTTQITIL